MEFKYVLNSNNNLHMLYFFQPLNMEHVTQLASSSLITGYYEQQDSIFWNNLAKDSTAYLLDNIPFPKEDRFI
jgi:hypothetical protein